MVCLTISGIRMDTMLARSGEITVCAYRILLSKTAFRCFIAHHDALPEAGATEAVKALDVHARRSILPVARVNPKHIHRKTVVPLAM